VTKDLSRSEPGSAGTGKYTKETTVWPMMPCPSVGALQADAIFESGLQRGDAPSAGQARQAAAAAIQAFGYTGCAERVAQDFGDHPETAVLRMRWARAVAGEAFADSASERGPRVDADALPVIRPWLHAGQPPGSREAMA
jgi:hypothetical protein